MSDSQDQGLGGMRCLRPRCEIGQKKGGFGVISCNCLGKSLYAVPVKGQLVNKIQDKLKIRPCPSRRRNTIGQHVHLTYLIATLLSLALSQSSQERALANLTFVPLSPSPCRMSRCIRQISLRKPCKSVLLRVRLLSSFFCKALLFLMLPQSPCTHKADSMSLLKRQVPEFWNS